MARAADEAARLLLPLPSATVEIGHGREVEVRPLHPDDKPLLLEGFNQLSPRARYLRFLTSTDRLSRTQLAYLSELDFSDHVAWGVFWDRKPAAVGRFIRLAADQKSADVALTVIDQYQGRGIGRMLICLLGLSARARGVDRFVFDVLAENEAMLGLLRSFDASFTSEGPLVEAELHTRTIPQPRVTSGDLMALLDGASQRGARTDPQSSG